MSECGSYLRGGRIGEKPTYTYTVAGTGCREATLPIHAVDAGEGTSTHLHDFFYRFERFEILRMRISSDLCRLLDSSNHAEPRTLNMSHVKSNAA